MQAPTPLVTNYTMATKRDQSHLSASPVNGDHHSDDTGILHKSASPSNNPPPAKGAGNTPPPPLPNPPPGDETNPSRSAQHRFLSPTEWARVAHGIGAIREGETHQVVHPTCWYWPAKGLPDGLYRDVVTARTKYLTLYQSTSTLRWVLLVLQITIGAILTALGSVHLSNKLTVTALAAANTIDAGLLALLHNSGMPDRYRLDKAEFVQVEDFLKVCPPFLIPGPVTNLWRTHRKSWTRASSKPIRQWTASSTNASPASRTPKPLCWRTSLKTTTPPRGPPETRPLRILHRMCALPPGTRERRERSGGRGNEVWALMVLFMYVTGHLIKLCIWANIFCPDQHALGRGWQAVRVGEYVPRAR